MRGMMTVPMMVCPKCQRPLAEIPGTAATDKGQPVFCRTDNWSGYYVPADEPEHAKGILAIDHVKVKR